MLVCLVVTLATLHWHSKQISYDRLEELLSQNNWIEADRETSRIVGKLTMEAVDKRFFFGYSRLDIFGLDTLRTLTSDLPCEDLQKIDALWSKYSSEKFGFTAQLDILSRLGIVAKLDGRRRTFNYRDVDKFKEELQWSWPLRDGAVGSNAWYGSINNWPVGFLPSHLWAISNSRKTIGGGTVILVLDKFRQCRP
jgi:hypothetical protein